jgi:hypothetical protein
MYVYEAMEKHPDVDVVEDFQENLGFPDDDMHLGE